MALCYTNLNYIVKTPTHHYEIYLVWTAAEGMTTDSE